ncbi:RNA-binding motif protein, X-linked 2-like isoform X2 [Agrilus planipennis]|uniref:RNA-binding motif protein, X-linked 2-like isoform X2 n=1 Tax=Agrilus planipennis TaxID=224129 RepID=A0A7F5R874_AGRPL|nr:RNA-binding motif protein, X-linked 2-like isoform X2 [Agrilus planipennis]
MNPLTNMKNVKKLSEQELKTNSKSSWHDQYKDSAWVFVGGLPYDLTEGDIICIFSQYGEIVNINLVRDKDTGKSKGFCFICFEDQRSTILVVDNFNGLKILGRTLRVDHVSDYKVPKEGKKTDEETKRLYSEGCAPQIIAKPKVGINPVKIEHDDVRETLADQISGEIRLPPRLPIYPIKQEKFEDDNDEKNRNMSVLVKKKVQKQMRIKIHKSIEKLQHSKAGIKVILKVVIHNKKAREKVKNL